MIVSGRRELTPMDYVDLSIMHYLLIRGYPLIMLASKGRGGVKQILTFANKRSLKC